MFRRNDPARELLDIIESSHKPPSLLQRLRSRQKAVASRLTYRQSHRSDFIVAGLGIALGLTCALFPWYIFFNQEKFGVRALKFAGGGQNQQRTPLAQGEIAERVGAPMSVEDIPPMKLDLFATGSLRRSKEDEAGIATTLEQPYPGPKIDFTLVHVANGRAMIQDNAGLWVVQRGSVLPDSSRVESIEQRDGKWVLVTSNEEILQVSH